MKSSRVTIENNLTPSETDAHVSKEKSSPRQTTKNLPFTGHGRIEHPDGDVYEGEWLNNRANGFGEYIHANRAVLISNLRSGSDTKDTGRMISNTVEDRNGTLMDPTMKVNSIKE